ncbi:hypothetical protein Pint_30930 [Pistacia integerrima]|uniref:Uncharacterized protein n=1 Tax=Pistacia integerrima TaxID=434235 RepID=A0ACC0XSK0_9ROSI|nr:hypothetical protein Pint_30930 [Pistacia integerrima]
MKSLDDLEELSLLFWLSLYLSGKSLLLHFLSLSLLKLHIFCLLKFVSSWNKLTGLEISFITYVCTSLSNSRYGREEEEWHPESSRKNLINI